MVFPLPGAGKKITARHLFFQSFVARQSGAKMRFASLPLEPERKQQKNRPATQQSPPKYLT
jgi:hypothetical protein